jgi:N-acetylglutamate synthase-like GNAT family acetyltransferase
VVSERSRAGADQVRIREAAPVDRERVRAFYLSSGHTGLLARADRLVVAERGGELVGVVRLCEEEDVQVLRTMRVRPDVQRRGVGRALLEHFVTLLDDRSCYCLPFAHLIPFYGLVRFREIAPDALPPHLARRLAQYRTERPGVAMIAMVRP